MADWQPDPTGKHELRYHDGLAWTDHVADNGVQSVDPYQHEVSPPTHAVHSMQPTSKVTIWQGERKNLTHAASSGRLVGASYRITEDGLYFQKGVLSSSEEIIPLWAIIDVDVHQSITQKARGVGTCVVHLDTKGFNYGQSRVLLESVEEPKAVRDLLARYANTRRSEMLEYQHNKEVERRQAGATAIHIPQVTGAASASPVVQTPPAPATSARSIAQELRELAELRDAGILTEEEFSAQKAQILSGN